LRILHTSDWHVGKVLKGQPRLDEQTAVLAELVAIARAEQPDLVLVAGDLFDSGAPTPAATRLVTGALTALRGTGAEVVAIAGNHDNGPALDALRPWAEAAGITLRGTVRSKEDHIVKGDGWQLVALPFLSQRYAVRATELFELSAAEATQTYADHLARMVAALTEEFGDACEPNRNRGPNLRMARANATNIVPANVPGVRHALDRVLPELAGRIAATAMRVPVRATSAAALTLRLLHPADAEHVNGTLEAAAASLLKGYLEVSQDPLVSSDAIGSPASSVVDAGLTMTNGNLVQVVGWYDNEWGYAHRLVDLIRFIARLSH
jgi:hypothetical protein